jgi:hypothetical protein
LRRDAWIKELRLLGARTPDKSPTGTIYVEATEEQEDHEHHHE